MEKVLNYTKQIPILVFFLLSSCASVHNRFEAVDELNKGKEQPLNISSEINSDLTSKHFRMIEFTFENMTDDWIKLSDVIIDFPDKVKRTNIKIVSGNELIQWNKSTNARNAIQRHNNQVVLSALAGVGILAMGGSDSAGDVGAAVAIGSLTSLSVMEFSRKAKKVSGPAIFPESHLLYGDILIPPRLFTKKWLVIESKDELLLRKINSLYMHCKNQNKESHKFRVKFSYRQSI